MIAQAVVLPVGPALVLVWVRPAPGWGKVGVPVGRLGPLERDGEGGYVAWDGHEPPLHVEILIEAEAATAAWIWISVWLPKTFVTV